ncbi:MULTISPECIES: hypothetical protein [Propionimicrobium]|nr:MULTISPECIES: hypothetical protein [Propionimicrobium]
MKILRPRLRLGPRAATMGKIFKHQLHVFAHRQLAWGYNKYPAIKPG